MNEWISTGCNNGFTECVRLWHNSAGKKMTSTKAFWFRFMFENSPTLLQAQKFVGVEINYTSGWQRPHWLGRLQEVTILTHWNSTKEEEILEIWEIIHLWYMYVCDGYNNESCDDPFRLICYQLENYYLSRFSNSVDFLVWLCDK